jgi:high-affinity nickel-transport protein
MGLGLETASEVTLLSLTASTATGGALPLLAVLSLPILFAAGMSTFDTADSLLMTRAYSWSYRNPVRTLFYNTVTTAVTVVIAVVVAGVYLAGVLAEHLGVTWLAPVGAIADNFELLGYGVATAFLVTWGGAVLWWKLGRHGSRSRAVGESAVP